MLQLKIAAQTVEAHRRAVWDIAKHHIWWLFGISALSLLLGVSVTTAYDVRAGVIVLGQLGGFVLALLGLVTVSSQAKALNRAVEEYERLVGELDPDGSAMMFERGGKKAGPKVYVWFQVALVLCAGMCAVGIAAVVIYTLMYR